MYFKINKVSVLLKALVFRFAEACSDKTLESYYECLCIQRVFLQKIIIIVMGESETPGTKMYLFSEKYVMILT